MQDGSSRILAIPPKEEFHMHRTHTVMNKDRRNGEATESKRKCRRRERRGFFVSALGATEGLDTTRTNLLIKVETCGSDGVIFTHRGLSLTSWFQTLRDHDGGLFSFSSRAVMSTDLIPDLRASGGPDRSRIRQAAHIQGYYGGDKGRGLRLSIVFRLGRAEAAQRMRLERSNATIPSHQMTNSPSQ